MQLFTFVQVYLHQSHSVTHFLQFASLILWIYQGGERAREATGSREQILQNSHQPELPSRAETRTKSPNNYRPFHNSHQTHSNNMASTHPLLLVGLGMTAALLGSAGGAASGSGASASYLMSLYHHNRLTTPPTPRQLVLALCPIIISGVLAIYGLIIAVLIHGKVFATNGGQDVDVVVGYKCLTSGLAVGVATLTSGLGIAYFMQNCSRCHPAKPNRGPEQEPLVEDAGAPVVVMKPVDPNVYMVVSLVFLEAIALYGLIAALLVVGSVGDKS